MQVDAQLHSAIYTATRNQTLEHFCRLLRHQATHLWYLVEDETPWCRSITVEWVEMLDSLAARDWERSAVLQRAHVQRFITEIERPLRVIRQSIRLLPAAGPRWLFSLRSSEPVGSRSKFVMHL
jgi:DNA-binding GntR family transcriptional regulator